MALRSSYLRSEPTGGAAPINCPINHESLILSELELQQSQRASTPGGVGARHRLRGGFGRSNVLSLIDGAQLHGLRGPSLGHTVHLSPPRSVLLEGRGRAHLQWSDRAADSKLTLKFRP